MSEPWCALASGIAAATEAVVECGAKKVRDREEQNKETVTAFYDLMFNQSKPREAIEIYTGAPMSSTTHTSATASRRSSTTSSGWPSSTRGSGSSSSV